MPGRSINVDFRDTLPDIKHHKLAQWGGFNTTLMATENIMCHSNNNRSEQIDN